MNCQFCYMGRMGLLMFLLLPLLLLLLQVGCAMNCQFCYTGRMGLLGHLSAAQIVEQVRGGSGSRAVARVPIQPINQLTTN